MSRAAFEAWIEGSLWETQFAQAIAWDAWQAARNAALEEAARYITEDGAHEPNDVQAAAIQAMKAQPDKPLDSGDWPLPEARRA